MNLKNILFISLGLLLVTTFFFKVIPIPLETIDGNLDTTHFEYGGMYYTSILNELNIHNYLGSLSFLVLFGFMFILNYFMVEDN
jgi:hypothetical protein